jgi:hypothetical protein
MMIDPNRIVEPIRTSRRFGVTSDLTPQQRAELMMLRMNVGWPVLLDVLEMACIEQETSLINTDPADKSAVLANHRMAKAMWQAFEHMQDKVESELRSHLESVANQPVYTDRTDEEAYQENLLNPTLLYTSEDDGI